MQIKELEEELPVSLIERRKSGNRADRAGRGDRQARAYHLASVRDVLDSAKHRERVLSGALKRSRPISCRRHSPSCNGAPRISLFFIVRRPPRLLFERWSA